MTSKWRVTEVGTPAYGDSLAVPNHRIRQAMRPKQVHPRSSQRPDSARYFFG
jgi:hypothetical protein